MKAPRFWKNDNKSILPVLLFPVSAIYALLDRINRKGKTTRSVSVPVICVGNVVAGGAGKTPVALSIAEFLSQSGWNIHFLTRGYGGNMIGPVRVVLDVHSAQEVGDEPLILANVAPTWVSKDRYLGAEAAVKAGADVIIMDDGFQNTTLKKDLSFLVVDGGFGIGNGKLLPAGPLREPLANALGRATAVIVVGKQENPDMLENANLPVFKAKIVPHALQKELIGEKVVAFAGIGRPEKFFQSLRDAGADVIDAIEFPDHHKFQQDDIMSLVEKAALHNAALVTTRKDYVRLSADAQMMTTVFDIDLVFEKPQALQTLLTSNLGSRQHA